jgi:hypothetical protein
VRGHGHTVDDLCRKSLLVATRRGAYSVSVAGLLEYRKWNTLIWLRDTLIRTGAFYEPPHLVIARLHGEATRRWIMMFPSQKARERYRHGSMVVFQFVGMDSSNMPFVGIVSNCSDSSGAPDYSVTRDYLATGRFSTHYSTELEPRAVVSLVGSGAAYSRVSQSVQRHLLEPARAGMDIVTARAALAKVIRRSSRADPLVGPNALVGVIEPSAEDDHVNAATRHLGIKTETQDYEFGVGPCFAYWKTAEQTCSSSFHWKLPNDPPGVLSRIPLIGSGGSEEETWCRIVTGRGIEIGLGPGIAQRSPDRDSFERMPTISGAPEGKLPLHMFIGEGGADKGPSCRWTQFGFEVLSEHISVHSSAPRMKTKEGVGFSVGDELVRIPSGQRVCDEYGWALEGSGLPKNFWLSVSAQWVKKGVVE